MASGALFTPDELSLIIDALIYQSEYYGLLVGLHFEDPAKRSFYHSHQLRLLALRQRFECLLDDESFEELPE